MQILLLESDPEKARLAETDLKKSFPDVEIMHSHGIADALLRVKELEAVVRVSELLNEENYLPHALKQALSQILEALSLPAGAIWFYEGSGKTLSQVASTGWMEELAKNSFSPEKDLTGHFFTSTEPIFISHALPRPQTSSATPLLIPPGWSIVSNPIRTQTDTLGVLMVSYPGEDKLSQSQISFLNTVSRLIGSAGQRVMLSNQTEFYVNRLTALRDIDTAISSSFDLHVTLEIVLNHALNQLNVDAASILLYNNATQRLEFSVGHGFRHLNYKKTNLQLGESYAGQVAVMRDTLVVKDFKESASIKTPLPEERFKFYCGVPLIAKGHIIGVLQAFRRSPFSPEADWLEFIEAIAGQSAIAIDNAQLFNNLQQSNIRLALAYETTLEGWGKALELRDQETEGHTLRVTELTAKLGARMGYSGEALINIRRGALLHDIGKMGIPDNILRKPGALNHLEKTIMRQHPQYAYDLLSPIEYLLPAIDIPYCHHEKWDGSGYPRGLKGDEIPQPARMFTVTDVWDALRSDRPYRKSWSKKRVIHYIFSNSGVLFDPEVVTIFLNMVKNNEVE